MLIENILLIKSFIAVIKWLVVKDFSFLESIAMHIAQSIPNLSFEWKIFLDKIFLVSSNTIMVIE